MLVKVNDFCKCVNLKTGCVIIGALTISFLLLILIFAFGKDVGIEQGSEFSNITNYVFGTLSIAFFIIAGALLIAGTYQDNKGFMLVYFVLATIAVLITTIFMVRSTLTEFQIPNYWTGFLTLIAALGLIEKSIVETV